MKRWLGIAILVILVHGWDEALAQSRGAVELGLDGGVGMAIVNDATLITVGFPLQGLRVGWFADDRTEIEPSVTFHRVSAHTEPSNPYFTYDRVEEAGAAELAVSYHGGGTGETGRVFVKGGGLALFTSGSNSQFGVEAGFGWKQRFDPHWALRIEAAVGRTFDSGALEGGWMPTLALGFSHFSKAE